ncbi:MAG: hypothetical protein DMF62_12460 [Acidobacteria bacterium]|nr:MAG: hypothetical protein DMF62_12460 [Acidobacteriota bacterium]
MNFHESEEYLFSLGNEVEAMKLGLENIRKLLAALGDPQKSYLKVQVAGTNGKGSVCAFLDSICLQAEIKTGVFTSPHLVSITERVRINGVDISEGEFARLATRVREASELLVERGEIERVPTYFEQVTAIALVAFAEVNVELTILETGLGGRYDAVTAANAEIAGITRIDLDHQQYLGETIEEIAAEKAAIIRSDSKVVIGEQANEAMKAVKDRCFALGVVPILARDIVVTKDRNTTVRECATFVMKRGAHSLPLVFPPVSLGLAGAHQLENAKTAILLAEILQEYFPATEGNILEGLKHAKHPGRLESIGKFLLDGAHNLGGAKALAAYLDEFITEPITLVFGAMRDKDVSEIAAILFPRAHKIILTEPANSRAMRVSELFRIIPAVVSADVVKLVKYVKDAVSAAQEATPEDGIILITGSLYLIGDAKRVIEQKSRI